MGRRMRDLIKKVRALLPITHGRLEREQKRHAEQLLYLNLRHEEELSIRSKAIDRILDLYFQTKYSIDSRSGDYVICLRLNARMMPYFREDRRIIAKQIARQVEGELSVAHFIGED